MVECGWMWVCEYELYSHSPVGGWVAALTAIQFSLLLCFWHLQSGYGFCFGISHFSNRTSSAPNTQIHQYRHRQGGGARVVEGGAEQFTKCVSKSSLWLEIHSKSECKAALIDGVSSQQIIELPLSGTGLFALQLVVGSRTNKGIILCTLNMRESSIRMGSSCYRSSGQ